MPTYKLPPLPKPKKAEVVPSSVGMSESGVPDQWRRTISIPVNDEILQQLKVGDQVTVKLVGQVSGTRDTESKSEDYEHIDKSIEVMVTEVTAYPYAPDDEIREGMAKGYEEG